MRVSGRLFVLSCFVVCGLVSIVSYVVAQPPNRSERGSVPGGSANNDPSAFVARMMTFDVNHDGKLTKDELTDSRLGALFERADIDKDGVVTTDELDALFKKESSSLQRGGPGGGPGGWFGFGGGGPGGPGGPGGNGPPPIGQVLPPPFQEMLQLTPEQRKKIDDLQKQVDASLAQILTSDQQQQFEQFKSGGPGGFGPPPRGGPDGPGGPGRNGRGGPPPGGRRPPGPPGDRPN